jgi:hypothetical protein
MGSVSWLIVGLAILGPLLLYVTFRPYAGTLPAKVLFSAVSGGILYGVFRSIALKDGAVAIPLTALTGAVEIAVAVTIMHFIEILTRGWRSRI